MKTPTTRPDTTGDPWLQHAGAALARGLSSEDAAALADDEVGTEVAARTPDGTLTPAGSAVWEARAAQLRAAGSTTHDAMVGAHAFVDSAEGQALVDAEGARCRASALVAMAMAALVTPPGGIDASKRQGKRRRGPSKRRR